MAQVLQHSFTLKRNDDDGKKSVSSALFVWNRSREKSQQLREKIECTISNSPAEIAEECDVVYAMLADPQASIAVAKEFVIGLQKSEDLMKKNGQTVALKKTYVEMSTIDKETSEIVKEMIERDGLGEYLSAPVSGGVKDASCGELLILAGGSRSAYERCEEDFKAMGKKSWFMGDCVKNATDAKMALQIMMGGQVALLAECFAFCEHAGVDGKVWFDVLDLGVMMNPLLRSVGQRMIDGVEKKRTWPKASFQTYLQQKDLKLAIETAEKINLELPVSAAVHQRYVKTSQKGHAYHDFASLRDSYDAPQTKSA